MTLKTYTNLQETNLVRHVTVAREENAYLGSPFEGGLWSLDGGRELLVAALHRPCAYQRRAEVSDPQLHDGPVSLRTWRSRDGGENWESAAEIFNLPALKTAVTRGLPPAELQPVLAEPDLLLSAVTAFVTDAERAVVHLSTDRGATWSGPMILGAAGIADASQRCLGQASATLRADGARLLFLTRPGPDGTLRPAVILVEAFPGNRYLIGLMPADPDFDHVFPNAVSLPDGTLVAAVTRGRPDSPGHTLIYHSADLGRTWELTGRGNEIGQPGHLALLPDGRLLLTYGWPLPPYRILARISADGGRTWGPELLVREGGGSADLGGVRSVTRDDGAVVSVYQWNLPGEEGRFQGGRRFLAATIWRV